jgi:HAMP domain-containing protein
MEKKKKTFAGRLTHRILFWVVLLMIVISYVIMHLQVKATREFYTEIYHNKMLISYEYTRRVISDVHVAVSNNVYYIEHTLDDPDGHKETMARIVKSGTRVRSCGISFIKDFYPDRGHKFVPYAWRNVAYPDVIWKEDLGDASLDYFDSDWFLDVVNSDSTQWSEPFYDGQDQKTTLSAYMAPIHDETGRVVAVLGADVSLDWLTNKLTQIDSTMNINAISMADRFGLKTKSYIINHDGTYITHNDESKIMNGNFFDDIESCEGSDVQELISNMSQGIMCEDSHHSKFTLDGEDCFVFFTPVKYTNWVLVSIVPCSAIYVIGLINGAGVLLILLLAVLIVVVVCYYFVRNGVEPIKWLSISVTDITKGKYDTPMPEMKYNDEICELRDAIEKMQYSISNYVDEVKRKADTPEKTEEK